MCRLNGDYNPLHIDPEFSGQGGFEVPILHGLCTYALSTKHVLQALGHDNPANLRWVKVRYQTGSFTPVLDSAQRHSMFGRSPALAMGPATSVMCTVQARFAGHVLPGQTLQTRMWAVSATKVIFQTRVVERNSLVVSNAAVEFRPGVLDSLERERATL